MRGRMAERLTVGDVGCWVLKSRTAPQDIASDWLPGTVQRLSRCLRRSYRLELMQPGQPCLLWLSGSVDPGVHAVGTLTDAPDVEDATGVHTAGVLPEPAVSVALLRLVRPVPRRDLLSDHVLAGAEVLRMPAGSNPSYLDVERWSALLGLLDPTDRARAGGAWGHPQPGAPRL